MIDPAETRGWPASMVAIAELIGAAAAQALVDAHAGTTVYIPRRGTGGPLARLIGDEAAVMLASRYGGDRIEVPTMFSARSRKAEIAGAEGSHYDIARRYGVSARWVRAVRNAAGDDRQRDLFPAPIR